MVRLPGRWSLLDHYNILLLLLGIQSGDELAKPLPLILGFSSLWQFGRGRLSVVAI